MAKIKTNKSDYAPGETSVITADGFASGSTLTFNVQHVIDTGYDGIWGTPDDTLGNNTGAGHEPWSVTDGGTGDLDGKVNGKIQTTWYVNPDDSLNETFLLTATGSGGNGTFGTADDEVATASFTDAVGSTNKVYQHWADGDAATGSAAGWNNNILSANKSDYFQGEVIPHDFIYKASSQAPLINGQSYTFNITYNYYQANTNSGGFAYMTTYNTSRQPTLNITTIQPTSDSTFTNGGGMQGAFYTVDADITNVSAVTYTGSSTKDGHVTVTFTYTGKTTTNGVAEIFYGLYVAEPGRVPDQGVGLTNGAGSWTGGSLQTTVDIGGSGATSIQLSPAGIIVGEISGVKFNDINGDGTRDTDGIDNIAGNADDEVGLAGWTIFLDSNSNGKLDAGETSTVTGTGGVYKLSVTPDANKSTIFNDPYIVLEVSQAGWTQTTTNPAPILITSLDPTETNVNFGNQLIRPNYTIVKDVSSVEGGKGLSADSAGDVINYGIVLTNTGNQSLTGVTLSDAFATTLSDKTESISNNNILDVGETWTYAATHTVSQAEMDAGGILTNVVIAKSTQAGDKSDDATTPVIQTPNYTIVKDVSSVEGGKGLSADSAGDVINYGIVLTNTGNQSLTGVSLDDPFATTVSATHTETGGTGVNGDGKLDVGETWTYTATHTVTQTEINLGAVLVNTATADTDQTLLPKSDDATTPVIQPPIVFTGNPQFNFPNDVSKIQPKLQGGSFTINPHGYIFWDLFTSNTVQASIDPESGTSDYDSLTVSIVQVWTGEAQDAIYRVYVANETDNAVSLANNTDIVRYTILGDDPATSKFGDPNKGLIDLINADPLIGNFNNFNNIENALTKDAVDGFKTEPNSLTVGADKVWSSPNETGTATAEAPKDYYDTLGGNDALYGRNNTGSETLSGGDDNDLIDGRDGTNEIIGGAGDDKLFGSLGRDILNGGDGNDILFGSYDFDILTGGSDADTFIVRLGDYDSIKDFNAAEGDKICVWVDTLNTNDTAPTDHHITAYTDGVLFIDGSPVVELSGIPPLDFINNVFFT